MILILLYQLAVSELITLIWNYKYLTYMAGNDIRKSVATTIVNAPFKLILKKGTV